MVMTDIYSRYTKVFFNTKFRGEEIIAAIDKFIGVFIKPKYVISDNGSQYCSKIVKSYFKTNEIKHILIPPYHPQSNGISERMNNTIAEVLRMFKGESIRHIIKIIEHRINNNINTTLGVSPREVVFKNNFYDYDSNVIEDIKPKKLELRKEEKNRIDLKPGDYVYKKNLNKNKLEQKYIGPFKIEDVGEKAR